MVYTTGACWGSVAPLAYGLLGDAVGIEYAIAVIGAVVLLSLPLFLVCVRPSHSANPLVPEGIQDRIDVGVQLMFSFLH